MRASLEYSRKACWLLFVQWGLLSKSRIYYAVAACLSIVSVCDRRLDGEYTIVLSIANVMIADLTWVPQCLTWNIILLFYLMTVFSSQATRTTPHIVSVLTHFVPPKYIFCTVACVQQYVVMIGSSKICSQCRLLCSTFDLDDEKLACVIFRSNIWSRRFGIRSLDLIMVRKMTEIQSWKITGRTYKEELIKYFLRDHPEVMTE